MYRIRLTLFYLKKIWSSLRNTDTLILHPGEDWADFFARHCFPRVTDTTAVIEAVLSTINNQILEHK